MSFFLRFLWLVVLGGCIVPAALAADGTVVFQQPGFPAADTSPVSSAALAAGFPDARMVNAAQLEAALVAA